MSEYIKTLAICAVGAVVVNQVYASVISPPATDSSTIPVAWSGSGQAFIPGETPSIDGQQIHDLCHEQSFRTRVSENIPARIKRSVVSAKYVSCYGSEMEARLQRLCSAAVKARYLRHIKAYFLIIKGDAVEYERAMAAKSDVVLNAIMDTEAVDLTGGTADAGDFDADPTIVGQLNGFVRNGLLSIKDDLAPIMDIKLITENPSAKETAAARKDHCE